MSLVVGFYGGEVVSRKLLEKGPGMTPLLSIQWHITAACRNRCRHCYMFEPAARARESKGGLDRAGRRGVLARFEEFERDLGVRIGSVTVTGGDPLLCEDFREIAEYIRGSGRRLAVLGTPETITDESARMLADLKPDYFQMSLDGLEATHDGLRGPGSFRRTIRALERLRALGVETAVMFTAFPNNADEAPGLIDYLAESATVGRFGFDLGCAMGAATDFRAFTAEEVQALFDRYYRAKAELRAAGHGILFGEKNNLFSLTRFDHRDFYPISCEGASEIAGCPAGWTGLTILSDGTVLACRKLAVPLGRLPGDPLGDLFFGSPVMRKLRRPDTWDGCGECDFRQWCRGCPALVHNLTGDPFARNPVCFRSQLGSPTGEEKLAPSGPPLEADMEIERAWVERSMSATWADLVREATDDAALRPVFLDLGSDPATRSEFLADPRKRNPAGLSDRQLAFLVRYFSISGEDGARPDPGADKVTRLMAGRLAVELLYT